MKLKKIVAPMLAAVMLSQAVPALAVSGHPFTDVPAWADEAVSYSYEKGYINGTTATTYNSDGEISIVEFIKIMVQMCTTEDQRTTILEEAGATPEQIAADWTYQYRVIGEKIGLYAGLEQYTTNKGETKCTRAVMAHILMNALDARNEDVPTADAYTYVFCFKDSATVMSNSYAADIGTAVSLGLISGDNNRNFNPDGMMDRASAAQVLHRLDNPSGQREAVLKQIGLSGSTGSNGGDYVDIPTTNPSAVHTFDMRTPATEFHDPKEGDLVIRPDGSQITLVRDKTTGVLGYGQNVGVYLNASTNNGHIIVEGAFDAASKMGFSDVLAGGTYIKSNLPGQESTYHWSSEWQAIRTATYPGKDAKGNDQQVTADGLWKYSSSAAGGNGNWLWQGPQGI